MAFRFQQQDNRSKGQSSNAGLPKGAPPVPSVPAPASVSRVESTQPPRAGGSPAYQPPPQQQQTPVQQVARARMQQAQASPVSRQPAQIRPMAATSPHPVGAMNQAMAAQALSTPVAGVGMQYNPMAAQAPMSPYMLQVEGAEEPVDASEVHTPTEVPHYDPDASQEKSDKQFTGKNPVYQTMTSDGLTTEADPEDIVGLVAKKMMEGAGVLSDEDIEDRVERFRKAQWDQARRRMYERKIELAQTGLMGTGAGQMALAAMEMEAARDIGNAEADMRVDLLRANMQAEAQYLNTIGGYANNMRAQNLMEQQAVIDAAMQGPEALNELLGANGFTPKDYEKLSQELRDCGSNLACVLEKLMSIKLTKGDTLAYVEPGSDAPRLDEEGKILPPKRHWESSLSGSGADTGSGLPG